MSSRRAIWAFGLWLALVGGLLLGGCTPAICGRTSDCSSGLICTTVGACVIPPVDAGVDDGTTDIVEDAPSTTIRDADGDAQGIEPIDAEAIDAGVIDAAPATDANTIDAPNDDGLTRSTFDGVW